MMISGIENIQITGISYDFDSHNNTHDLGSFLFSKKENIDIYSDEIRPIRKHICGWCFSDA